MRERKKRFIFVTASFVLGFLWLLIGCLLSYNEATGRWGLRPDEVLLLCIPALICFLPMAYRLFVQNRFFCFTKIKNSLLKLNYKKGLLRLWLILSILWIPFTVIVFYIEDNRDFLYTFTYLFNREVLEIEKFNQANQKLATYAFLLKFVKPGRDIYAELGGQPVAAKKKKKKAVYLLSCDDERKAKLREAEIKAAYFWPRRGGGGLSNFVSDSDNSYSSQIAERFSKIFRAFSQNKMQNVETGTIHKNVLCDVVSLVAMGEIPQQSIDELNVLLEKAISSLEDEKNNLRADKPNYRWVLIVFAPLLLAVPASILLYWTVIVLFKILFMLGKIMFLPIKWVVNGFN